MRRPFDFELRLYEGWMAGSAVERCRWSWTLFDGLNHIELSFQELPFNVVETMDMMGRKIKPTSGQWVLQRDQHGRVRKGGDQRMMSPASAPSSGVTNRKPPSSVEAISTIP